MVAFLSASLMLAEVVSMHQWKIALGVDVAHLVVPTAMAGTAMGAALAAFPADTTERRWGRWIMLTVLLYALVAPAPFMMLAVQGGWDRWTQGRALIENLGAVEGPMLLIGSVQALSFAAAGGALALTFRAWRHPPGRLYGASLLASAGAVLGLPALLDGIEVPGTIALLSALGFLAFALSTHQIALAPPHRRLLGAASVLVAAMCLLLLPAASQVRVYGDDAVFAASNSLAHVEARRDGDAGRRFGDPRRKGRGRREDLDLYVLSIDDRTSTRAIRYLDLEDCAFMRRDPGYLPFVLRPSRRVLICGCGGGPDVIMALLEGAERVTAVEIDALCVDATRALGSPVYDDPRVDTVVDDGRHYLMAHPDAAWDAIELPHVKVFGGATTPVLQIKDYMLTRESMAECLRHLSPSGMLIIRDSPDTARCYLDTLLAAIGTPHAPAPLRLTSGHDTLLIYSPSGFTSGEIARLEAAANGLARMEPLSAGQLERSRKGILTSSDDCPYMVRSDFDVMTRKKASLPLRPIYSARTVLLVGFAIACLPLVPGERRFRLSSFLLAVAMMAGGAGFLMFELVFMDRLVPFIGHPMVSITLALGTMLLGAGLGSLLADRLPLARAAPLAGGAALAAIALLAAVFYALPALAQPLAGSPWARQALAVMAVGVPSVLLGIPFPVGMRLAAHLSSRTIAALWAASGSGAVMVGLLTPSIAFQLGLAAELRIAAGASALGALGLLAYGALRGGGR
jgi:hypothetical protein